MPQTTIMKEPALAMIEFNSVARGIFAADAVVKKSQVRLLNANPICPGKYMIIFVGEVANVEESLAAGIAAAGDGVINNLFLPNVHEDIIPAVAATTTIKAFGAVGILETFSVLVGR